MIVFAASAAIAVDTSELPGCRCIGTVGNVNCDYADRVTMVDVATLIDHLFITGARLPNLDEANINGDAAKIIDIADVVMLIDHLYIDGVPLPDCPRPFNSPPETTVFGTTPGLPFIDGPQSGAPTTGVFLSWAGQDLVDHPYYPPPFEFEYRLYGPYTDSLYQVIRDSFMAPVFQTNTGELLRIGLPPDTVGCDTLYDGTEIDTIICRTLGTHYITCDTTWNGGVRQIACDTVLIDTLEVATEFGHLDTLFDILAPAFAINPNLNRLTRTSGSGSNVWITTTSDTLYDLFAGWNADTTVQMKFLFWVRVRDPLDSLLYDPTPEFLTLDVIDPRHERGVLVLNWTPSASPNRALIDSLPGFWAEVLGEYASFRGLSSADLFVPDRDFRHAGDFWQGPSLLTLVLRYKTVILSQDAAISGSWSVPSRLRDQVQVAIASGVNAWVAARVPLGQHSFGAVRSVNLAPEDYAYFFGVTSSVFSGWGSYLFDNVDGDGFGLPRIEDFVGAEAEDSVHWPDLEIDTALLRSRFSWRGSIDPPVYPYYPFLPEIGALPEVGWVEPSADAEVLYRYRSLYGNSHPISPDLIFENLPVMHRLDRGLFRTVHANFAPYVLSPASGQPMINAVLDWLLLPRIEDSGSVTSVNAMPAASAFDVRRWYLNLRASQDSVTTSARKSLSP